MRAFKLPAMFAIRRGALGIAARYAACFAVATATLACSSTGSSSSGSGLDSSKKLSALSATDLQSLCDWTAAQEGGYGTVVACDAAPTSLQASKDQATCVAEGEQHFWQPICSATVGDWMACVKWRLSNWCFADPPPPSGACEAIQTGCYGSNPTDAGAE